MRISILPTSAHRCPAHSQVRSVGKPEIMIWTMATLVVAVVVWLYSSGVRLIKVLPWALAVQKVSLVIHFSSSVELSNGIETSFLLLSDWVCQIENEMQFRPTKIKGMSFNNSNIIYRLNHFVIKL